MLQMLVSAHLSTLIKLGSDPGYYLSQWISDADPVSKYLDYVLFYIYFSLTFIR